MTWAAARTAIDANLVLAAADVTPAIPAVIDYEPDTLMQDTLAHWPEGTRLSGEGNSLNLAFIARGVRVTGYLRVASRTGSQNAELEARLVALEEAAFTRLWADAGCGGNTLSLQIDGSDYGWQDIAGQLARTVSFIAWYELPAVASIAL